MTSNDLYFSNGTEVQLFEWPTLPAHAGDADRPQPGCGKTRFVEHMGHLLGREVITISRHDDLTSADLVGRFMVTGGDVVGSTARSPKRSRRAPSATSTRWWRPGTIRWRSCIRSPTTGAHCSWTGG